MPRPKGNGPGHGGPATGAGWGGPAKGEGNHGPGPGRGHTHRSVADLMAAQNAREIAAQRWLEILNDPAHPHHATMVVKAAERLDGAPVQRQDVTLRDVRPEDLTDEELAAIAAGGRRASVAGKAAPED